MVITGIIMIGLALSMDAFAVSIATGASLKKDRFFEALRIATAFGFFQAIMPIIGAGIGIKFKNLISDWDHWVAFLILLIIGLKMIYEAHFIEKEEKKEGGVLSYKTLIILSIGTSIDAMATGFSISLIGDNIIFSAMIIGIVTFLVCFCGVFLGEKIGHFLEGKIETAGGIILILVGLKILLSHL
ncbi:MAG TPA: manganese efflux pump MntP family protein [Victivallales bacterium]|nr:manganese efflux pump MntP family protein [Victivallales bacterium]HPO91379.1 manganese efflux pump MntP family protein [Victivallales bacterium]HRR29606.1 manganese efflux pump MntP family protein [Victivallales bacterium]HRU00889.1 manganese efflux pump MntP family protein [Victivallales bacterium]